MPAKTTTANHRLEEAMALLLQNQATLVQTQVVFVQRLAQFKRDAAERFARLEERLNRIESILVEHTQVLQNLPDAIRQRIRFRPAE